VLVALSIDRYDAITHPMNFSGSCKYSFIFWDKLIYMGRILLKLSLLRFFLQLDSYLNQPFKDKAQTALFKDPVRTAL
jgi:hypothetical protein